MENKRLLEWASKFKDEDFSKKGILELHHARTTMMLNLDIGFDESRFLENGSEEYILRYLRKQAAIVTELFENIYTFSKTNDDGLIKWKDDRCLPFYGNTNDIGSGLHSSCEVEFRKKPFVSNSKRLKTFRVLVEALCCINLSCFRRCPPCNKIFFHWRKKERKYCSKKCQNLEAVRRFRKCHQ